MKAVGFPAPGRLRPLAVAVFAVLAAGLIGISSSSEPRLLFMMVAALGLAAFAFSHFTGGLVLFTLVSFFELLPAAYLGNLTIVKAVGALLTLAWFARVVDRQSNVRVMLWEKPWLTAAAVGFTLWAVISGVWAPDLGTTVSFSARLALNVVLVFVVYSAVQTVEHLRWVIWAFLLGAFLTTGYGLVNGLTAGTSGRLVGGLEDPNFLAAVIVASIVLTGFMFVTSRGFQRLLLVAILGVLLPSLFLTGSRGGIVALFVAILAAIVFAGPIRLQVVATTLIVVAFTVGYYVTVASVGARARVTAISASDSAGRVDQYNIALRVVGDHPLVGVGLGNFTVVEPNYTTATTSFYDVKALVANNPVHNMYLSVLAELGVVGVVLLAVFLGGCLVSGVQGYRERSRAGDLEGELLARGVVVATLAFLVAYALLPGLLDKQLWLMLGLCAALSGLQRSSRPTPSS